MVEVVGSGGDAGVAKLAGDDGDVDSFGTELGRVSVVQAVGGLLDGRRPGKLDRSVRRGPR